jgi:hypothetical protein
MQAAAETIERHMREEAEQAAEAPQAGAEHGGDRAR